MAASGPPNRQWPLVAGVALVLVIVLTGAVLGLRAGPGTPGSGRSPQPAGPPEPSAAPQQDRAPDGALLPNLRVLPAEELSIESLGAFRTLRFASVLFNDGDGPLQITPRPGAPCPPRQRHVLQSVYLDRDADREFLRGRDTASAPLPGGCMLFHPLHDHWHFDGSARYALTEIGSDEPIVARKKVSFCLRDSEPLVGAVERHRRTYEKCARDRRQGISVGWADRYDASLPGQTLDLPPGLGNGSFCLRLTADPFGLLRESDEDDNTSAIVVRITGRVVERDRTLGC